MGGGAEDRFHASESSLTDDMPVAPFDGMSKSMSDATDVIPLEGSSGRGMCIIDRHLPPGTVSLTKAMQMQRERLLHCCHALEEKKEKIRSYRPGDGIIEAGGVRKAGFAIPNMTTLLLVGLSGAGKSSLINKMIRVLSDQTIGFNRAQIYDEKGSGSLFLQEYSFFKGENYFTIFDSRGFSEESVLDDLDVVKEWMIDGIRHGQGVVRKSDNGAIKEGIEARGRDGHKSRAVCRRVDSVIFVIDAVSIYNLKEQDDMAGLERLATVYKSPYISFKDDRPIVVMTHGDLLTNKECDITKKFIGEIFGVPSTNQIFNIPCFTEMMPDSGNDDVINDLALLDMLDLALERADRSFPYKNTNAMRLSKAYGVILVSWSAMDDAHRAILVMIVTLWFFCLAFLLAKLFLYGWGSYRGKVHDKDLLLNLRNIFHSLLQLKKTRKFSW